MSRSSVVVPRTRSCKVDLRASSFRVGDVWLAGAPVVLVWAQLCASRKSFEVAIARARF